MSDDRISVKIAGLDICVKYHTPQCGRILRDFLEGFITEDIPDPCFSIEFSPQKQLIQFGFNHTDRNERDDTIDMTVGMGHIDKAARYAVIPDVADQSEAVADFILDNFLRICIQYAIPRKNGVILHSSAVVEKNKSLVFVAPNEGGKSTIAENTGRKILSDDCVGLRKSSDGSWAACATPWGNVRSSGEYPLEAIFFIEKADDFYCERIGSIPAVKNLFANVSLSFPDIEKCADGILDNVLGVVTEISTGIPVYSLGFRKDDNVIELLKKTIAYSV